ncbi:MAG TPA: hypothetical protein VNE71_04650 [Myxococcota bacterium]|nr:hypothetical protein [Myxococcota bacterium]
MTAIGALRKTAERAVHGLVGPRHLARLARARGARGVALTFHTIPPETLERQLDVVARFFRVIGSAELAERARTRRSPPRSPSTTESAAT